MTILAMIAALGVVTIVYGDIAMGMILIATSLVGFLLPHIAMLIELLSMRAAFNIDVTATIEEEGLRTRTAASESLRRWAGIKRMEVRPRQPVLLFLREGPPTPLIIPRAAVTEDDLEHLIDRVRRAGGQVDDRRQT